MKYIKKVNTEEEFNAYWATSDYKDYSVISTTENNELTFGLGDTFPTPFKAETIDGEVYTADSPNSIPMEERDKVIKVFYTGDLSINLGIFHNLEEITYQRYATRTSRQIRLESPTKIKVLDLSNIRGKNKNSESRASISISDQDLLEEVILPDEWSCRMSQPTFEDCPNLKKIVIGDNNNFERANNYSPFYGLKSLIRLEFKGRSKHCSKQTMDAYADRNKITLNVMQHLAENCTNLEEIKYPTNLVGIGYNAFTGTKIKTFPNVTGLKYVDVNIGEFENITIPNTVEFLAAPPFICKGNTKISVTSTNKRYKENKQTIIDTYNNSMIVGCINSEIPDNVESIYHYCFTGNHDIVTVHLGNIKQIDGYAFNSCHKLKSIVIHTEATSSVPVLQNSAFNKCDALENIYVPIDKVNDYKAATNWNAIADKIKPMVPYTVIYDDDSKQTIDNFEEINETSMNIKSIVCGTQHTIKHCPASLTNITLSDHILTIEDNAFYNCIHLTEIILPNVRHIHNGFVGCSNLISVTIPQTIPPRIDFTALNPNANLKIYVPAEAIDTYKTDTEWSHYANKILPIPETDNNETNNNNSNN